MASVGERDCLHIYKSMGKLARKIKTFHADYEIDFLLLLCLPHGQDDVPFLENGHTVQIGRFKKVSKSVPQPLPSELAYLLGAISSCLFYLYASN